MYEEVIEEWLSDSDSEVDENKWCVFNTDVYF
jgi:hypothetical protein